MRRVFVLSRPAGRHLWALLLYSILAIVLTWPLALHLTTHVPGDGIDDPALAWNLWWLRERLVTQGNFDIFHAGWMFHPISVNLAFYTLTPLNGLLSIALQTGLSLILASNLLLLSSFVLGAYGTFLLVLDQVTTSHGERAHERVGRNIVVAALLGGLIFGFASSKLFYASLGQFNIASSQWIPFCMLYLLRMTRPVGLRWQLRNAGFAALFLTFQLWAELTYGSFLLLFVGVIFVWHALSQRRTVLRNLARFLAPYALLALLVLAGLAPFLWAMLPDLRAEGDFFASGGGFADIFSADLLGYLVPTRLHPLFGDWVATLPFPNDKGQHVFLGYSALLLALTGFWVAVRRPASRSLGWLWGVSALLFFWLTLGPTVRWVGADTGLPGPFAMLSQLPFFSGNRYPSRYSVMLMATVAVLSGFGVAWLLERFRAPREKSTSLILASVVVAGAFIFEHLAMPLPMSDFRIPSIYARLAAEPGDFAVLELPTGWRNGARVLGKSDLLIMMQQWYQTEYGKRRLGGNTSRNPEYKFQYFTQAPLLGDLIALMNADRPHIGAVIEERYPDLVAAARPVAGQILHDLGIRFVLVHEEKSPTALLRFVDDTLPLREVERWQGDDRAGAPSTIVLYAVQDTPRQDIRTISLVDDMSPLYLGEGWSTLPTADGVRYATRPDPILLLDLPEQGGELSLEWAAPATAVSVSVNGRKLESQIPAVGRTIVTIPPDLASEPVDRVELRMQGEPIAAGQVVVPESAGVWPIGTTDVSLPAAAWVVVRSTGEETGDFAQIFVNGRDVAPNERGYNLVAIAPDGTALASAAFDTSGDDTASGALAAWVKQWPDGTIIAGAVADEASLKLGEQAVAALRSIGAADDLRGKLRWAHAFIGTVGAEPGTAVEASDLLRPVTISVGSPVDGAAV